MKEKSARNTDVDLKLKGFKVYEVGRDIKTVPHYNRRAFYKICITNGYNKIVYGRNTFEHTGPILFFGNPEIPYAWEVHAPDYNGYACAFTSGFLNLNVPVPSLRQSSLYQSSELTILALNDVQSKFISTLFGKMMLETVSEYRFKDELIRNYINLILQEGIKMQPLKAL